MAGVVIVILCAAAMAAGSVISYRLFQMERPQEWFMTARILDECRGFVIYKHDQKELKDSKRVIRYVYQPEGCELSYSSTGQDGPYTLVVNAKSDGLIAGEKRYMEALFGPAQKGEKHDRP